MRVDRKCIVCGKPFTARSRRQRICSAECRKARQQAQIQNWMKAHRGEMLDYWVRYHLEHQGERSEKAARRYRKRKGKPNAEG